MKPLPMPYRLQDRASHLRLLVAGAHALVKDALSEMDSRHPATERVAVISALIETIEQKAVELGQLCDEVRDGT